MLKTKAITISKKRVEYHLKKKMINYEADQAKISLNIVQMIKIRKLGLKLQELIQKVIVFRNFAFFKGLQIFN